jgi:geranylgeranyl diphosphate synthase, type II
MTHSHAFAEDMFQIEDYSAESEERLSRVDPSRRVLLISHCLRSSDVCKASIETWGVDCVECNPRCQVNQLRRRALDLGYQGVCVAPGGSLALKYIKERNPAGIVAVACLKELEEGIDNVARLSGNGSQAPPIVLIPLTRDGCVNTEVNVEYAIEKISIGCPGLS